MTFSPHSFVVSTRIYIHLKRAERGINHDSKKVYQNYKPVSTNL